MLTYSLANAISCLTSSMAPSTNIKRDNIIVFLSLVKKGLTFSKMVAYVIYYFLKLQREKLMVFWSFFNYIKTGLKSIFLKKNHFFKF